MIPYLDYLANIPNFFLTWAIFFGTGLCLILFNLLRHRSSISVKEALHIFLPFNPITSRSFHADVKIKILRKLFDRILVLPESVTVAFVASAFAYPMKQAFDLEAARAPTAFSAAACVFVLIVFTELGYYSHHYMNHKVPFFWELHKVHHSAKQLTPLTDARAHVLPCVIQPMIVGVTAGIPSAVIMGYFDINVVEMILITGISIEAFKFATLYPLKHSHFPLGFGPLDWIIVSPHMHQVHHSSETPHWDKNMGVNLSIFDWMFGTFYRPVKGERVTFGIGDAGDGAQEEFESLWDLYVEPLKRSFRTLRRPQASEPVTG